MRLDPGGSRGGISRFERCTLDPGVHPSNGRAITHSSRSTARTLASTTCSAHRTPSRFPAKHELTELALVEPPEALGGAAVTVMDGPFFSLMPYPSRGLYTLSHVRYTPHCNWHDTTESAGDRRAHDGAARRGTSTWCAMRRATFRPCAGTRYVDSLWEIKTVMPRSEKDDSRPSCCAAASSTRSLITVLGAKIDSVYDVEDALLAELAQRPVRRVPRPTPTDVRRLPDFDRRPARRR